MPSSSSGNKAVNWVTLDKIRALFNGSQYSQKIEKGLLQKIVLKKTLLQNPNEKGEPKGTYSEVILYKEQSTDFYAIVHQYSRPDGSIGASGKPDPKRLKIGGIIYAVQNKSP